MRAKDDIDALLLMRDEDDRCPKHTGPATAAAVADLELPFPTAIVLPHREYESLFLASLGSIAGQPLADPSGVQRPGPGAGASFEGDPESPRDAKGKLSALYPPGKRYKETLDQLPLTQLVDFSLVRQRGLRWFGTLQNALRFLDAHRGEHAVYPPPVPEGPPGT